MRMSLVGVMDIQTPSVVRMAEPAKEVPTKWFKAKLLPTDCSPINKMSEYVVTEPLKVYHTH